MASKYSKNKKKKQIKFVMNNWKVLLALFFVAVVVIAIGYYLGWFDSILNKRKTAFEGKNITTTVDDIKDVEVNFLDVGQGDCIVIELPDGKNMIIDSGDKSTKAKDAIEDFATANNITTFDYLLLTHSDADHVGQMSSVIEKYEVGYIFRPNNYSRNEISKDLSSDFNYGSGYVCTTQAYANFMVSAKNEGCPVEVFNKDSDFTNTVICGSQTITYSFDFLTPTGSDISYSDANNYSPIVEFSYAGRKIMFNGDAELKNLNEYVTTYGNSHNVDVLKVGHHGSENATTEAFIEAIDPEFAIIQCGEGNKYGHPTKDALDILKAYDSDMTLYRTDKNGNIILRISTDGNMVFSMDTDDVSSNFTPAIKPLSAGVQDIPSNEYLWVIPSKINKWMVA